MSKRFAVPLETSIVSKGATVSALAKAVRDKLSAANQPGLSIERDISEIWSLTLGVHEIGIDDDFFDLGGTSLGLINVVIEMSKRFAVPLETSIVSKGATVSALAKAVRERAASQSGSLLECFAAQ